MNCGMNSTEGHRSTEVMRIPKIVFSDLDGTLIRYRQPEITQEIFDAIRELTGAGIVFCPASGRTHQSLRKMFAPVADDVYFICENGAAVFYRGELAANRVMPRSEWLRVAHAFLEMTDGKGEVLVTSPHAAYMIDHGRGIRDAMDIQRVAYRLVDRPEDVADPDVCKVALFVREGVGPYLERLGEVTKNWRPAAAAVDWMDTGCADKADGVRMVCERLGIELSETAAFGDNYNDCPMLDLVGQPFIMDTAAAELLERYPRHMSDPAQEMRRIAAAARKG